MPNFANSDIGHGSGAIVQNGKYYFTVIEEWDDGAVSFNFIGYLDVVTHVITGGRREKNEFDLQHRFLQRNS